MVILAENSAFQNLGLCIEKKCKDTDQIDDFLQLCIQMIFYDKISLSGLVPVYIAQRSKEIIDTLKREDTFFDIDFQNISNKDSDELIKEVGDVYYRKMDDNLEEYKTIIKNAKGLLPKLNNETLEKIKKVTEAIKNGSIDTINNGDLYRQSTFSTDSSLVKIVSYKEDMFKELYKFSKDYDWNEAMSLQLISDLRVLTNKLLATKNRKPYSPAVRRGRKEKQLIEKSFLSRIEKITKDVAIELCGPTIEMPSLKDYLVISGKGKPNDILKIASDLRIRFSPVRDYIKDMGKNKVSDSLQTLNEISKRVIEEAKAGKPLSCKKVIENIKDINLGPIALSYPVFPEINRETKLEHCVLAFTETIEDMIWNKEGNFYKELIKNCMEE